MPREATAPPDVRLREPQVVVSSPTDTGGTRKIHPAFAELFARAGLNHAAAFLELPGEVVSGHADRHVMRVEIPGAPRAFYLKRQHVVGWREKFLNRRAGFGWVSRCEREAELLEQLDAANLPAPHWAAFGAHGGRAFLLAEEVPDAVDLRRILSDNALSIVQRRKLAVRLGEAVAAVHAAGFSTPDLTAKHVLVNPDTLGITFLDWPSATRGVVSDAARADALGALHASLTLASSADRVRVLRGYCARICLSERRGVSPQVRKNQHEKQPRAKNQARLAFASGNALAGLRRAARQDLTQNVLRAANRHAKRRSVRDQLQPEAPSQRLVWLAGEAVCAIPEIAAVWPKPAIAPPFYGFGADGTTHVRIAGRDAVLVRGCTSAPLGRFRALVRATPWRSAGVTIGRVLFHLERYGVPAPRLLAFGQRLTSAARADWFALYEVPNGVPLRKWRHTASSGARRVTFGEVSRCLEKLHAAGCVLTNAQTAFAVCNGRVCVADPRAVRIVRGVSDSSRRRDLRTVAWLLGVE